MREISEDLNIPIKTVYLYRKLGLFESHKFGKHYRVSAQSYEIFKFNALGEVLAMMEGI
jgi:DNA-binding transcriptional MerR regulator